jgi:8-oxo-dGTP diphosphatase
MPNTEAESAAGTRLVHVAVAVIVNERGEVLLTRRHPESHQGGFWEFPGGKVESGESLAAALKREIAEEIALEVLEHTPLIQIEHDYGDRQVLLDVHRVNRFSGDPRPCEGQPMRWVALSALQDYAFPEANRPIVDCLSKTAGQH